VLCRTAFSFGLLDRDGAGWRMAPHFDQILGDPESSFYLACAPRVHMAVGDDYPGYARHFRDGTTRPYQQHDEAFMREVAEALKALPRIFLDLVLPRLPALGARLEEGARVLDVGCGIGWSSISLAKAFPFLRVDGIDSDEASIAEAQRLAAEAGVDGRVRFRVVDAAELGAAGEGGYDAAFIFEALHDMARPVEALEAIRALLADDGVVIVADEKVAETFTAPGDDVERLNFAFSWWHCLPASRAETPSVAAGTALRADTVRQWADHAGFASLQVLPVDHVFWRFYELSG
jgi:predicted O-methyltransferase YrrM